MYLYEIAKQQRRVCVQLWIVIVVSNRKYECHPVPAVCCVLSAE